MRGARWGSFACATACAALLVAPARADPTSDANDLFTRGRQLFLEERYDEALKALEESDRLATSPNTTLLAARCQDKLGRRERAVRAFDAAATGARARVTAGEPRYRPTLDAAVAERERLKADMGTLLVQTRAAPTGRRDRHAARGGDDRRPRRGRARPPRRALHDHHPRWGGPEETREVTLETGKRITLRVGEGALPPPAPSASPGSDWQLPVGIVGASLGALSMGAGIVLWTQAERVHSELVADCGSRCDPITDEQKSKASDGKTFMWGGNIAFVAGAVVGVVGGILLVTRAARGGGDRVGVRVAPGAGSLRATVTFAPLRE